MRKLLLQKINIRAAAKIFLRGIYSMTYFIGKRYEDIECQGCIQRRMEDNRGFGINATKISQN